MPKAAKPKADAVRIESQATEMSFPCTDKGDGDGNPNGESAQSEAPSKTAAKNIFPFTADPDAELWEWDIGVRRECEDKDAVDQIRRFEELEKLELPTSVLRAIDIECEPEFFEQIQAWATTNPGQLSPDDPYHIVKRLSLLAAAYSRTRHALENSLKENRLRRGVDELIDMAFRWGTSFKIRFDEYVQLPRIVSPIPGSPAAPRNPIADTLVTAPIDQDTSRTLHMKVLKTLKPLNMPAPPVLANLSWQPSGTLPLSLIVFAFEYKGDLVDKAKGKNQVIYDLATAQYQRRALGLPTQDLMGVCCASGALHFITMWWNNNKDVQLSAYIHKRGFKLRDPVDFVTVYSIMSKISSTMKDLGKEVGLDVQKTIEALIKFPWRPVSPHSRSRGRPKKRSKSQVEERNPDGPHDAEVANTDATLDSTPLTANLVNLIPRDLASLPRRVGEWQEGLIREGVAKEE